MDKREEASRCVRYFLGTLAGIGTDEPFDGDRYAYESAEGGAAVRVVDKETEVTVLEGLENQTGSVRVRIMNRPIPFRDPAGTAAPVLNAAGIDISLKPRSTQKLYLNGRVWSDPSEPNHAEVGYDLSVVEDDRNLKLLKRINLEDDFKTMIYRGIEHGLSPESVEEAFRRAYVT